MRIDWHQSLESTQDVAHELAAGGAEHGTAVVAREQTRGRGTRGRSWSSGPGGLWLTVILRPERALQVEGTSLRVGMTLAAMLERQLGMAGAVALKWPNDLVVADRKLGGILCEARWLGDRPGWIAVGLGLNVANTIPAELAESSISLAGLGRGIPPAELAEPAIAAIIRAGERSGPLDPAELAEFATRDWLRGRRLAGPRPGTAAGIEPDGRLVVVGDDGSRELVLGSVTVAAGLAPGRGSR